MTDIVVEALERLRRVVVQRGEPNLNHSGVFWLLCQVDPDMAYCSSLRPRLAQAESLGQLTPISLALLGFSPDVESHDPEELERCLGSTLSGSATTLERTGWADHSLIAAGLLLLAQRLGLNEASRQLLARRDNLCSDGPLGVRVIVCRVFGMPLYDSGPVDADRVGALAAMYLAHRSGLTRGAEDDDGAALLVKRLTAGDDPIRPDLDGALTLGALELIAARRGATDLPSDSWGARVQVRRVLWIGASPSDRDDLRLRQEQSVLKLLAGDHIEFEFEMTGTTLKLDRYLAHGRFDMVHVSAHGDATSLVFESESGGSEVVEYEILVDYLQSFAIPHGSLKCVVLSCCFSAEAVEGIDNRALSIVTIESGVPDQSALEFAESFYRHVGEGVDFGLAVRRANKYVQLRQDPNFDALFVEPTS